MVNNAEKVEESAKIFKDRIIKNCKFADALNIKKSLLQRKDQVEEKIREYSNRRDSLLINDEKLGTEIADLISDCKNPDSLSKKRREIKLEIEDLSMWISESEKMLIAIQDDVNESATGVHQIVQVAAIQESVRLGEEISADLKVIDDKISAYSSACRSLASDFGIPVITCRIKIANGILSGYLSNM
jgi:uncharacterized coiled-coil DUF342 family protein